MNKVGEILLVGLGNPGREYEATKHNAGFMAIDALAREIGATGGVRKFDALYASARLGATKLHLLKPQTYMNLSGKSVLAAAQFYHLEPSAVWVIHDELDLPLGDMRVKVGGGHAGHNGLRSIIDTSGSKDFVRFRIGIGRPNFSDVVNYVLSPFNVAQRNEFEKIMEISTKVIVLAVEQGLTASMNYCNGLYKAKLIEEANGD